MRPFDFLIVLCVVLAAILAIDHLYRRRRSRIIASVGVEFRMNYSAMDRFALTERLLVAPKWTLHACELIVKDVLYATRNGTRCFVATAKCRSSLDQDHERFIIRFLERDDHQAPIGLAWERSENVGSDPELYRKLLRAWMESAPPTTAA